MQIYLPLSQQDRRREPTHRKHDHGFSKDAPEGFPRFALYQYPCNAQLTFGGCLEMAECKSVLSRIMEPMVPKLECLFYYRDLFGF